MSIIRGTQLIGHTVRMGGQSARDWILLVTIMWFTTFGVMSYLQVDINNYILYILLFN